MTTYSFKECRKRLATLWVVLSAVMFVIPLAQTFLGGLGAKPTDAWGWFFANTVPTLSLIGTNLITDAAPGKKTAVSDTVEPFFYRFSLGVSTFYLVVMLAVIFGWRLTSFEEPADFMVFSSVFMGPLQGIAVLFISMFFKKGPDAKPSADREANASKPERA